MKEFLLLMGIGDSFGMKYEFVPHEQDKTAADLFYGPHPKYTAYPQGHYTDDTQMSLAIAELLLRQSSAPRSLTEDDFIDVWLQAFKRDPHEGYSKFMYKVMSESSDVTAFQQSLNPSQGVTSGGAMRAGPIGLLPNVEDVKALAMLQAKITHDTPAGINSALAVALTVHFLHHGGARENLAGFLTQHIGKNWHAAENGYTEDPHNGLKIVTQAIRAFQKAGTLSEVLLTAVNQDQVSDTDTVCALAMIMASRCADIKKDLPGVLYKELENGTYGADHLKKIDQAAESLFPATTLYKEKRCLPKKTDLRP